MAKPDTHQCIYGLCTVGQPALRLTADIDSVASHTMEL